MIRLKNLLKEVRVPESYYDSYSAAVQAARKYATDSGYDIDEEDWSNRIALGPGKPHGGQTTRSSIGLTKNGKPQRKALHIVVYNRNRPMADRVGSGMTHSMYELTCYIS